MQTQFHIQHLGECCYVDFWFPFSIFATKTIKKGLGEIRSSSDSFRETHMAIELFQMTTFSVVIIYISFFAISH